MFKRILALLVVLTLLVGCAVAETVTMDDTSAQTIFDALPYHTTETITMGDATHQIERRVYPLYILNTQYALDVPLYFVDGVDDLPYMDFVEFLTLSVSTYPILRDDKYSNFAVAIDRFDDDTGEIVFSRDNGSQITFNYHKGTLEWNDYDRFYLDDQGYYIDPVGSHKTDASGQPYLLQRIRSRERHGEKVVINLPDYGIPVIVPDGYGINAVMEGEKCLIPLQTLSSFCFFDLSMRLYFNGESLILQYVSAMEEPFDWNTIIQLAISLDLITKEALTEAFVKYNTEDGIITYILSELMKTELGQMIVNQIAVAYETSTYYLFLSGQTGERSPELAEYGYNELCLEMDHFYGLKEIHDIDNFDSFLSQTGLKDDLLSTDSQRADDAIYQLTRYWLDDGHSGLISSSFAEYSTSPEVTIGQGLLSLINLNQQLNLIRAEHPESLEDYYEVGNTAYVTFDEFSANSSMEYYYTFLKTGNLPDDTITLIAYAHQQITRENSPIENVVLDLSCNGGGATVAAAFVMSWFLGEANISIADTFSGAQSTATYRADVNLDHKFDESDTVSHLNLYCLISPFSFSCANLVPWEFKADGSVTLLGKTSGGGSCIVGYSSTAWGTSFQFSSPRRLSFVKNGSFYDIDQGVAPDYFINSYDNYYDREALTEFINSLY